MNEWHKLLGIVGLATSVISVFISVAYSFHYWYSFFIVGSFLFFDYLDLKIRKDSTLMHPKRFLKIYLLFSLVGGVFDVILARRIANLWVYPYLGGILNVAVPTFIYNPFGGFSIYEMYQVANQKLRKLSKKIIDFGVIEKIGKFRLSVTMLITTYFILYSLWPGKLSLFIFSPILVIAVLILIERATNRKASSIFSLLLTSWVAGFLHELPNVFSQEWIYFPTIGQSILGIPILVYIIFAGWPLLLSATIVVYEKIK